MPIRCAPLLVLQVGVPAVEVGLAVEGVVHLGGVRQADPPLALLLPAQLGAGEVVWEGGGELSNISKNIKSVLKSTWALVGFAGVSV